MTIFTWFLMCVQSFPDLSTGLSPNPPPFFLWNAPAQPLTYPCAKPPLLFFH